MSWREWMERWGGKTDSASAPVPIESWIAAFNEANPGSFQYDLSVRILNRDLEAALNTYLASIPREYHRKELTDLFYAAKHATPIHPSLYPALVERKILVMLKTPLFAFSAPDVPGCSVNVQTYASQDLSAEWTVAFGAGGGLTTKVRTSLKATFTAGDGEHKQLFVPIAAIASRRFRVQKRARKHALSLRGLGSEEVTFTPLSRGFDAIRTITFDQYEGQPVPGVESVPSVHLPYPSVGPASAAPSTSLTAHRGRVLAVYKLAGDHSGRLAEYEYTHEESRAYNVTSGGSALGLQVSAAGSVTLTSGVVLKFTLAAGHDYYLYSLPTRPGIYWEVRG